MSKNLTSFQVVLLANGTIRLPGLLFTPAEVQSAEFLQKLDKEKPILKRERNYEITSISHSEFSSKFFGATLTSFSESDDLFSLDARTALRAALLDFLLAVFFALEGAMFNFQDF